MARARGAVRHRGRGPARGRARRRLVAASTSSSPPDVGIAGDRGRARPARRRLDARVGDARDRVWPLPARRRGPAAGAPPSTCTASATPATSARSSAPRRRSPARGSCSGAGSADRLLAEGGAGEHGRALRRAAEPRRARVATPAPRLALIAHGGGDARRGDRRARVGRRRSCLGAEREGLPAEVDDACDATATIPLREGAESLNVAAAAAIALQRIGSLGAAGEPADRCSNGSNSCETRPGPRSRRRRTPPRSRRRASATWAARPS